MNPFNEPSIWVWYFIFWPVIFLAARHWGGKIPLVGKGVVWGMNIMLQCWFFPSPCRGQPSRPWQKSKGKKQMSPLARWQKDFSKPCSNEQGEKSKNSSRDPRAQLRLHLRPLPRSPAVVSTTAGRPFFCRHPPGCKPFFPGVPFLSIQVSHFKTVNKLYGTKYIQTSFSAQRRLSRQGVPKSTPSAQTRSKLKIGEYISFRRRGYRITVIIRVFQTCDEGSTPSTRSTKITFFAKVIFAS